MYSERKNPMSQNASNNSMRKKRAQIQQSVIALCCIAMLLFNAVWIVRTAVVGKVKVAVCTADSSSVSDSSSLPDSVAEVVPDDSSADSQPDNTEQENVEDDFSDAVFIGNSRTVSLEMNSDKPLATFYASTGLNVSTVGTEQSILLDDGSYGTVYDALAQKQFSRVYIMFGINEIGWPYPDVFQEDYEELIKTVMELQPDATVYVQSILPVSSLALSSGDVFTNENVDNFNLYVQNAAANTGATYLDVASVIKDENGELPLDASTDGIHLGREYCEIWMNYLAENS